MSEIRSDEERYSHRQSNSVFTHIHDLITSINRPFLASYNTSMNLNLNGRHRSYRVSGHTRAGGSSQT